MEQTNTTEDLGKVTGKLLTFSLDSQARSGLLSIAGPGETWPASRYPTLFFCVFTSYFFCLFVCLLSLLFFFPVPTCIFFVHLCLGDACRQSLHPGLGSAGRGETNKRELQRGACVPPARGHSVLFSGCCTWML